MGIAGSTSLDGLGLALMETDGIDVYRQGPAFVIPYEEELLEQIRSVLGKRADSPEHAAEIRRAETVFTEFAAAAVKDFVREEGVSPDILGFAGHTICHRPSEHYTHQIGDGRRLAELTGIKTAARFRSADILAGGQGAPFAPVYYEALTAKMRRPLAVIDVGGTSEVVWFGTSGEMKAFVSGPGNAVINDWVMKHGGMHIDYNGRLAITGRVDEKILAVLMHHKYIALNPPKACDRTVFAEKMEHLEGLSLEDGAATATAFVAESIAYSMALYLPEPPEEAIVCGGGAKSPLWREILANVLGIPLTLPQTEQGPGYGGAMLAAVACGAYPSVQACAEALVHAKSTTQPDAALVEKYNARYAVWHKLYPALKVSFAEMEALQ